MLEPRPYPATGSGTFSERAAELEELKELLIYAQATALHEMWKNERLRTALKYVWDRCGPHTEIEPCRDAAEAAMRALGEK